MTQKPVCPKINLRTAIFALVLTCFLWGLEGCKSSSMVAADAAGEVDRLAVGEEIFRELEDELPYQASAMRSMDLLHMDLDVSFDWKNQRVIGKTKLRLTPYFYPQKIVVLDAKDFELGRVARIHNGQLETLSYRYDEQEIKIYLPEELTKEDTVELEINYVAFPDRNSGEGSAAINDTKGLYFIDPMDTIPGKPTMLWTQGETQHNSKWFPTIDRPNERLTHAIRLTVPDTLVSISNGRLVRQEKLGDGLRKDHWEMDLPHAPYLVVVAVGDFIKVSASHGNLPVGYYVERGYEKGAAKVFESTPQQIEFFEKTLGVAFPWQKYDQVVVRDFVSGAMENTTASIFMEELLLDEREALDSEWDYIIAHELFHQWFGDLVTAESWSNLTLNEAFANYSEYLWNAHRYGQDQADLKLVVEKEGYFAEADADPKELIRFKYADPEDLFDAHSYNKGGLVLHMLRRQLGDAAFFKGLNLYLTQHAFRVVEAHDLRLAMEQVSGQDLNGFFNQWFFAKGHPELEIEVDYSQPENLLLRFSQVQERGETPVFQLPITVSWYEGKVRKTKTVQLAKAQQEVALENGSPLSLVYVNEGQDVLMKGNQVLSNAQYVQQFKESQLGVARYEALDSLVSRSAAEELAVVLPLVIKDTFAAIRERGLSLLQAGSQWKETLPELEEEVYRLAEEDPQNKVRAGALEVLAEWNPSGYRGAFTRLARDPSYLVAGAALMGLARVADPTVELSWMETFEGETNFRMSVGLAEYFLVNKVLGKGPWFERTFSKLSGEGLYYFMGYYGTYYMDVEVSEKEKAIRHLFNVLEFNAKDYLRLGAFQTLLGFVTEEGVLDKMVAIAEKEQSEDLQSYYAYYLELLKEEN
ncbi:MAG: M1 family aminopeptidase [Bacteroidetes bacterium]|nr:M1 family aminopeptidase [Bacteroidota bacterium]